MTPPSVVRLEGYALHAGVTTAVTLAQSEGPLQWRKGAHRARHDDLRVARTDWGVSVTDGAGFTVDLVEHLLAALGGLGVRDGIVITVEGPEIPILDGGSLTFCDALAHLARRGASAGPELVVTREGSLDVGTSRYHFVPGPSVCVEAEVSFERLHLDGTRVRWDGDPGHFVDEVAPARTFGFIGDAANLWSHGRALLASPAVRENPDAARALARAVLLFDEDGRPLPGSAAPGPNEIGRHKLLDLIGDLALYGGPPRGSVVAVRPGHGATHRIVREALSSGLLSRQ